jgi:hypothetical protein
MSFTRSTGQGFKSSPSTKTLSVANAPSVLQRLAARSLTTSGLLVRIQQHFGHRLHLVWKSHRLHLVRKGASTHFVQDERCVEIVIPMGLDRFCRGLAADWIEGLCSCAFVCMIGSLLPTSRIRRHCFCGPRSPESQEYFFLDRSSLRYLHECKPHF